MLDLTQSARPIGKDDPDTLCLRYQMLHNALPRLIKSRPAHNFGHQVNGIEKRIYCSPHLEIFAMWY